MSSFSRFLLQRRLPQQFQGIRTFIDAQIKCVRDRGLDHAVEKEKNLMPLLALKDLIKSEPSKSLPVSLAADNKAELGLPFRAVEFIRRYPSIFQEFLPGGVGIHPHVRLTPEVLALDDEERLIFDRESTLKDAADRLLKLLMISRMNKIPLLVIDRMKWDLGLPPDYTRTLVPNYPDYFQISSIRNSNSGVETPALELVCWNTELAVSVMEKRAMKGDFSYKKGMPLAFPLQFTKGFEMDKKVKKWVDEWQKLPYISPYENATHLRAGSDEGEKWAVAVLHELLHLLISKKTEKENVLLLGEYMGLRSRFKKAVFYHPGIFYLSHKIRTETVILKEGYKRDLLIEKHPLMGMRYQYIHLMNKVKEQAKPDGKSDEDPRKHSVSKGAKGGAEQDDGSKEEQDEESVGNSDSGVEDDIDDDYDDDEEAESENGNEVGDRRSVAVNGGRGSRKVIPETRRPLRSSVQTRSKGRHPNIMVDKVPLKFFRKAEMKRGNGNGRSPDRSSYVKSRGRSTTDRRTFIQ